MIDHRFSAPEVATDFEEKSIAARLARRARTWMGVGNDLPAAPVRHRSLSALQAGMAGGQG
jgi:hypothetical protein